MHTTPTNAACLDSRLQYRVSQPDFAEFRTRVERLGGCLQPVHLNGHRTIRDAATNHVLEHHHGTVYAPCGNRRTSVCPACADRYAADAYHLIRTGLAGGKTIPTTVASKPRLFVTLTAPSFGKVHTHRTTHRGKTIPCGCGVHHHPDDTRLGTPIDPDEYDYQGAVLWQAHSGQLWHRFTMRLRRELARAAGIRVREFHDHARLSYAKVAEYQRRGLIHFHAAIRLDGPTGPDDPAPDWATTQLLTRAIEAATNHTRLARTLNLGGQERRCVFTWGTQTDIRPIRAHEAPEDDTGELSDGALAGYIAKYATKGTDITEAADRRIRSQRDIDHLQVHPHHRRMIQTAWNLGAHDDTTYLRRWAHMLGFRGHFLTKSQQYGLTFGHIRNTRKTWRHTETLERLGTDETSVIVINDWRYTGNGYTTSTERHLAAAIGERIRHHRKQHHRTEDHHEYL